MLSPRLVRALAAGVAAVALSALPAAAVGPVTAPPGSAPAAARSYPLPPIGAEVPSSMLAIKSLFEYGGTSYTVDFRGGIKQRVEVNPNDPVNSVRLRTVGFRVGAELPGGGSVTLEQSDVDIDPKSVLRLASHFPPAYDENDVILVSATVELPGREPVVLTGVEPLRLSATGLSQYPAKGDPYLMDRVLDFAHPDRPGTHAARLVTFDSKRAGL
ncbi:hypothetical protein ACFV94_14775 [Streptomyces sp. NPDC059896]|uniref:hypothetical protein n=1 Tax=unclassified Streptomyces TaxID=2593676 RepID=UPI003661C98C